MYDLSKLSLLSFEIGDRCNLQHIHDKCPINCRTYKNTERCLDTDTILDSIQMAKKLNFDGYIAFHYYNEPLLYLDRILEIINRAPNNKYLLWTNGLLLDRIPENNEFLSLFEYICITCYDPKNMPFFLRIKDIYKKVEIFDWELDDRLNAYDRPYCNKISCKRILFEIPIDYYGNVHLCCVDWNNQFQVGNIFDKSLYDIVRSDVYQSITKMSHKELIDENCPDICKRCNAVWEKYQAISPIEV